MPAAIESPTGFHSVTPRMVVSDVASQVAFLRAVFDASGQVQDGRPAEIRIGDSVVMVSQSGDHVVPAFTSQGTFRGRAES